MQALYYCDDLFRMHCPDCETNTSIALSWEGEECHGRLILLLIRWHSLVRHVTMRARAARRVAAVDIKTACCAHGT